MRSERQLKAQVDRWRDRAFETLAVLKQANDTGRQPWEIAAGWKELSGALAAWEETRRGS